ncbi:hypothetical protein WN944_016763 [Citrus x changshan-huyou]|uniref:Uncharacterized protein n=1 Tax=Citrus x changshan-huyou TaxID=2935761 RepID=A0AAP0QKN6_9ROSI
MYRVMGSSQWFNVLKCYHFMSGCKMAASEVFGRDRLHITMFDIHKLLGNFKIHFIYATRRYKLMSSVMWMCPMFQTKRTRGVSK